MTKYFLRILLVFQKIYLQSLYNINNFLTVFKNKLLMYVLFTVLVANFLFFVSGAEIRKKREVVFYK